MTKRAAQPGHEIIHHPMARRSVFPSFFQKQRDVPSFAMISDSPRVRKAGKPDEHFFNDLDALEDMDIIETVKYIHYTAWVESIFNIPKNSQSKNKIIPKLSPTSKKKSPPKSKKNS